MTFHCMDGPQFVYPSSVDRHLVCFHLLATVNDAAMNTGVQVTLGVPAFKSFVYLPTGAIAK